MKTRFRIIGKRKVMKGYREDQPADPGKTLNKLPEKIPLVKRTSVKATMERERKKKEEKNSSV